MTRHLVIGMGEVGTAVAEAFDVHHFRDIAEGDERLNGLQYDIMHICYPWSDRFVENTLDYERVYNPEYVVVHSTVPIGTCDPHGWVHAPVRGQHPDLANAIRTFRMHVGGVGSEEVVAIFHDAWIDAIAHPRAADTEAGKLLELAQFGAQVRIQHEIHAYCSEHGVDFDVAYRQFAQTYNLGYADMVPRFVRPVLDYVPGPLGGHCVAQNTPLLDSQFFDDLVGPISPFEADS